MDVSQNREHIGRVGRRADSALGIRQPLGGIPSPHQKRGVIVQNGGILRIVTQARCEVGASFAEISVLEFVFPGDEVARGGCSVVACLFQTVERIRIDAAILDNLADESWIVFQVIGRGELRQIARCLRACFRRGVSRRSSASIDAVD